MDTLRTRFPALVINLVVTGSLLFSPASYLRQNEAAAGHMTMAEQPAADQSQSAPPAQASLLPADPAGVPSPPAGGPRPTIAVTPNHGYAGQKLTVSGVGVSPYPGVRVSWLADDATLTAAVVNLEPSGAYSASLTVPSDIAPGPVRMCAAVTGSEMAEFSCTEFTVNPAPPGAVSGKLPFSVMAENGLPEVANLATISYNAQFLLVNASGAVAYTTPVQADGGFSFPEVAVGTYTGVVSGTTPVFLEPATIEVTPAKETTADITKMARSNVTTAVVTAVTAAPNGRSGNAFGYYVSGGPSLQITFSAIIASLVTSVGEVTIDFVDFWVLPEGGVPILIGRDTNGADGWQTRYDASLLPAGNPFLRVVPHPSNGEGKPLLRPLGVIANPATHRLVREGTVSWDPGTSTYLFTGRMPKLDGLLPFDASVTVPVIDYRVENKFDAWVYFAGRMYLNGDVQFSALSAGALARLLNKTHLNQNVNLLPEGGERLLLNVLELERSGLLLGPYELWSKSYELKIPVFSIGVKGLFYADMSVSLRVYGELYMTITIRPLVPAARVTLTPELGLELGLSFTVDVFGVLGGGLDAYTGAAIGLPFWLDTQDPHWVGLDDPCLYLYLRVRIWGKFIKKFTIWKKTILDWDTPAYCRRPRPQPLTVQGEEEPLPPRVLAAPAVASGPAGRMLSVYIEDVTPAAELPSPVVVARHWNAQANAWGAPAALTDGVYAVSDPTAAYVGPAGRALVAWAQNTLTQAEADALGNDPVDILARQEIFYAVWDGSAWSSPQRLMSDLQPDGLPALAGDATGATLAWIRHTDSDAATLYDVKVAVAQWDEGTHAWGPIELLDAGPASTANIAVAEPAEVASWNADAAAPQAPATELRVCATCAYTNVQAAVDAAGPGDLIKVAGGVYTGVQARAGVTQIVYINKSVTIRGGYTPSDWTTSDPIANPTTLDAQGKGRVLYITGSVAPVIEGLRLNGGDATGLGGVFVNNDAGGGVYILNAPATIKATEITGNRASYGGGVFLSRSPARLDANTISGNNAQHSGGGIYLYDSDGAVLQDNQVLSNTAIKYSGGIHLNMSAATVISNTIEANLATGIGGGGDCGGIYVGSSPATLEWNTVRDNAAVGAGGGVYIASYEPVQVRHSTVISNTASRGGGMYVRSSHATIEANTVISNTASYGGGIQLYDSRHTLIQTNLVAHNRAQNDGGGIHVAYGPGGNLMANTIISNTAIYDGGGVAAAGSVMLERNLIAGNQAGRYGGGTSLAGGAYDYFDLKNNRIERNVAGSDGGGLSMSGLGALTNTIVVSNRTGRKGAGIYARYSQNKGPQAAHTTLVDNYGGDGSGVYVDSSGSTGTTVMLTNTIVSGHTVGVMVAAGSTVSLDGVLWHDNGSNTAGAGTTTVTHALTGAPAFAADGYHLTRRSAAVDQGIDAGVADDIDGGIRPFGDAVDLGADEYGAAIGSLNAQVSVARRDGQVALAWMLDPDGNASTGDDRVIAIADRRPDGWRIETPAALPRGADSPSVAWRGDDELLLAFLVRGDVAGGLPDPGYGNRAILWAARRTGSAWQTAVVRDQAGAPARAEAPSLATASSGEALLLFRRFGEGSANAYLGQMALAQLAAGSLASQPLDLTRDAYQHWQPALAVNQATSQAQVLQVSRPAFAPITMAAALTPASAEPFLQPEALSNGPDPLTSLTVDAGPDPALDPALALSAVHATPGATVTITATVRNVGREVAEGLAVRFYAGTPMTGTLLATIPVIGSLSFNAARPVTITVTAQGGRQPLAAQVITSGGNLTDVNDVATADLGELPLPGFVSVSRSGHRSDALEISWLPLAVDGVAGYRILRAVVPGGPYELVGEVSGFLYTDTLLLRGRLYHYVVQAYDDQGARSARSAEVSGMIPAVAIYLPLIRR